MRKLLLCLLFLSILIFPSWVHADPSTYLNIPPTNAFDKIHSDNGTISAVNFSMPLTIKGGSGISVKSQNGTHTLTITNTATPNTHNGSYNTTQANNVNINSGGSKINFINGTGATVHLQNSGAGNQVNVTVSATGTAGVTSLNALTGALTIACVSGNTTCTTSGGNTITVNTAYNVVVTGGSAQTITKGITHTADITMSGANIKLGSNKLQTTNFDYKQATVLGQASSFIVPSTASGGVFSVGTGVDTVGAIQISSTKDVTTNYTALRISDGIAVGNAWSIFSINGGTGSLLPINIIMSATKLISFDTTNTITHYVDTLFKTKITQYNSINTAGWGVPAIYGSGRLTGLTAASGTVTSYTVGASDGVFEVSSNVLATNSISYSFMVMVDWTDESGTGRTTGLPFEGPFTPGVTGIITNTSGPSFEGFPITIHAKSGTAITIHTNSGGTYTTVTYNIDGIIKQVA